MQIAAGNPVSWDGTDFDDKIVDEDVVQLYVEHVIEWRFKHSTATKLIPEARRDEFRDTLKLSMTSSMDSIKGKAFAKSKAFALKYEIDTY